MKEYIIKAWHFILRAGIFFFCFSVLLVIVLRWMPVSYTPLMFVRYAQNVKSGNAKIEHDWVQMDDISNSMQLAVICTEDQNFLKHHGFDFESIQKAMDEAEDGGRQRGASTISQQTAKNVFLWPSSTYVRKGFEIWFTVLIEFFWSKQRILEVYLNSVEFGDGIYGCESAAQHFFHKSAKKLSMTESARLAVVLPNPIKYNAGKTTPYLLRRQAWALLQMNNWGGTLKFTNEDEDKISSGNSFKSENTK
jgi:monofunctional biosynthetic peptidoglycan transglycosylase